MVKGYGVDYEVNAKCQVYVCVCERECVSWHIQTHSVK